jgi:hypothetical protein
VLDNADGSSSLAASMFTIMELLEGWIDTVAVNGVYWGSHSALVAAVSHFPELRSKLELLRSGRNADRIEDEADDLWTWVRAASNLLAPYVPSSVAHDPPDGVGE